MLYVVSEDSLVPVLLVHAAPSVFSSLHLAPHHSIPPPADAKHRAESELGPQTRPRSNTLPKSFGSTLDQGAHDAAVEVKGPRPTREETLDLIQRRVKVKRQEDGWPDDIKVRVEHRCVKVQCDPVMDEWD